MMISPEAYYEMNLKGKSETKVLAIIGTLEDKITVLEAAIKHPVNDTLWQTKPSPKVCLQCTKLYLEQAKNALHEAKLVHTRGHIQ